MKKMNSPMKDQRKDTGALLSESHKAHPIIKFVDKMVATHPTIKFSIAVLFVL